LFAKFRELRSAKAVMRHFQEANFLVPVRPLDGGTRSAYPTSSLKALKPSPMTLSASGSGALDTRRMGSIRTTPMFLEEGQYPYHHPVALTRPNCRRAMR
jgi:hypothetical protein